MGWWFDAAVVAMFRDQPSDLFLAHYDSEPTLPIRHYAVLALVGRSSEIRQVDVDRMSAFGLASEPINPAGTLLYRAWIPIQIVVNHVSAVAMQVNTFPHHLTADENIWKKGCVEGPHQAGAGFTLCLTCRYLDVGEGQN
jgi:hypothetical protein